MPRVILLASNNANKHDELKRKLELGPGQLLLPAEIDADAPDRKAPPNPEENASSYAGNARIKAIAFSRWSGLPALADDSGLEIEALDGRPGLISARYAGPSCDAQDNIDKILGELQAFPEGSRRAKFICELSLCDGEQQLLTVRGECLGSISWQRLGEKGFGYDPIFVPENEQRSFAQMSKMEKDAISHRGRALVKLKAALLQNYPDWIA